MNMLNGYGDLVGGLVRDMVCKSILYKPPDNTQYDASNGWGDAQNNSNEGGDHISTSWQEAKGFVSTVSEKMIGGGIIQSGDVSILIPLVEMEVKPLKDGVIKNEDGEYKILKISKDPIDAMWKLYARPM